MQWWIDTIGNLGPLFVSVGSLLVAAAVWRANKSTSTSMVALSRRAAAVEDQKLRLQLLERRIDALTKVSSAITNFRRSGTVSDEDAAAVADTLEVAELIFELEERRAIATLLRQLWRWQSLGRQHARLLESTDPEDDARFQQCVGELGELEAAIYDSFNPLLEKLRSATRIVPVPLPEID